MKDVLIIIISVILFYSFTLLIFRLADNDKRRVIKWARKLNGSLCILSVCFFGLDTYTDGLESSMDLHKPNSLWLVFFNLLFFMCIRVVNWGHLRLESGKIRSKFNREYTERQGNFLLMLSIIGGPLITYGIIISYFNL